MATENRETKENESPKDRQKNKRKQMTGQRKKWNYMDNLLREAKDLAIDESWN